MSLKKTIGGIGLSTLVCFFIAFVCSELFLRTYPFTESRASSRATRRWYQKYWVPFNEKGYRDFPLRSHSSKPQIVFLGDSFTAGFGVRFEETFYFKAYQNKKDEFQFVNLGQVGASTKDELKNFGSYLQTYQPKVNTVVHQYLPNDIFDKNPPPPFGPIPILASLVNRSEFFTLVHTFFSNTINSPKWAELYTNTFNDSQKVELHLSDLSRTHSLIRTQNSRLIFLLFPFLDDSTAIQLSTRYLEPAVRNFKNSCKSGDILIDLTGLAINFSKRERTVSLIDSHPSAALHSAVATVLIDIFARNKSNYGGVQHCPL